MIVAKFEIGTVFPPDEVVGHFVVGLAAAMNDMLFLNRLMLAEDHLELSGAERLSLMRLVLGFVWETHLLVSKDLEHPSVGEFLDRLATAYPSDLDFSGQELVNFLRGEDGATAPTLRNVLQVARNSTFHYPKAGSGPLTAALSRLDDAATEGTYVAGEYQSSVRAEFADQIMLEIVFGSVKVETLMLGLSRTVVAIIHLAQVAVRVWTDEAGVVPEAS